MKQTSRTEYEMCLRIHDNNESDWLEDPTIFDNGRKKRTDHKHLKLSKHHHHHSLLVNLLN